MLAAVHTLAADILSGPVGQNIADPLITAMQFLIPAAIGISAIHKLMEHRESGGGVLVELITKGGGAILVLQLIKSMAGLG
jgi:hypothetical protein